MTVQDIAQFCCDTVGDNSSNAIDFAKRSIRLKYQTLYDAHNWRESHRTLSGITLDPTLGGILFLPYDTEEVIFLSLSYDGANYTRLTYRERDWIERFTSSQITLPGNSPWFYRGENLAWPAINPGIFTFTTSDTSVFTVYIEGRDANNFPIAETFTLQATTDDNGLVIPSSVSTVNSYAMVTTLSKTAGTMPLTISSSALGAMPISMAGTLTELIFTQIVLTPPPLFLNPDLTPRAVFVRTELKLKPDNLDNDMSVPRISHIWDALIEFTLSALYTRGRQLAKADSREAKAVQHIQAAVNVEKNQSEFRQQVVPTIYESGDYMGGGASYRVDSANPFGYIGAN